MPVDKHFCRATACNAADVMALAPDRVEAAHGVADDEQTLRETVGACRSGATHWRDKCCADTPRQAVSAARSAATDVGRNN